MHERSVPRNWMIRIRSIVMLTIVSCVLLNTPAARGQDMRRRTLVYNANAAKWDEMPAPTPGTPEAALFNIRKNISDGKYKSALRSVKSFIKKYKKTHELYPQVLLAKSEALIRLEEYDKAHETLQQFLNEFSGMAITSEALRQEFVIAEAFLGGAKRKVWGLKLFSGEDLGLEILDSITTDYPESRLAELAYKTKADHMFAKGDHVLAEMEYDRLIRAFPLSQYHQYAMRKSADSALASFGGVEYDEAALIEADERFEEYKTQYPATADSEDVGVVLDDIREKRAEKDYLIAQYYERTRHISSAVYYYRLVVNDWPKTLAASKSAVRLAVLSPDLTPPDPSDTETPSTSGGANGDGR